MGKFKMLACISNFREENKVNLMNVEELDIFLRKMTAVELIYRDKPDLQTAQTMIDDMRSDTENRLIQKCVNKNPNAEHMVQSYIDQSEFSTLTKKDAQPPHTNLRKNFLQKSDFIFNMHPRYLNVNSHSHQHIEMVYVYAGQCEHTINGQNINLYQGDVCLLDQNTMHSIRNIRENDIIINILLDPDYLKTILFRLSENDLFCSFFTKAIYQRADYNEFIIFKHKESSNLDQLMASMLCEYFKKNGYHKEVIVSYLVIFFAELMRIYSKQTDAEHYSELNNTKISNIIRYIQENYKTGSLASVSELFHFSPRHLSAKLKQLTGSTFMEIMLEERLKQACLLLRNSDMPISNIISEVGYDSPRFFYNIFKKKFGMTPTQYRSKYKLK